MNNHTKESNFNGRYIMAYGFIDNDKFNDIIVANQELNAFAVYFYNPITTVFELFPFQIVDKTKPDLKLVSVIAMKNNLSLQSMMVVFKESRTAQNIKIKIFKQIEKGKF